MDEQQAVIDRVAAFEAVLAENGGGNDALRAALDELKAFVGQRRDAASTESAVGDAARSLSTLSG